MVEGPSSLFAWPDGLWLLAGDRGDGIRISYVLPQVSFGKNKELMRDYPAGIIRINSFLSRKNGFGVTRSSIIQGFGRGFSFEICVCFLFSGLDVSYSQC